jgi:hypothetical protein
MVQGTRLRLRDQINLPRNAPHQIPLAELLHPKFVAEDVSAVEVCSAVIHRLMRKAAEAMQNRTLKSWTRTDSEIVLVDGATVPMPEPIENQRRFPQQARQRDCDCAQSAS